MVGDLVWQERAACRNIPDPEIFFPDKSELSKGNDAIMLCFGCKVREECREYKKRTNSKHGIWAGEFSRRDE